MVDQFPEEGKIDPGSGNDGWMEWLVVKVGKKWNGVEKFGLTRVEGKIPMISRIFRGIMKGRSNFLFRFNKKGS